MLQDLNAGWNLLEFGVTRQVTDTHTIPTRLSTITKLSNEVLIRFDGYRGLYLMHCHKLEHEDQGMMANFNVI